ncbi:MAG TPA: hypothetical protein VEC38_07190 [Candidatus Binataceae bacterium]|nr:hypothetical protein [Candidatus Binataceae bacterium]
MTYRQPARIPGILRRFEIEDRTTLACSLGKRLIHDLLAASGQEPPAARILFNVGTPEGSYVYAVAGGAPRTRRRMAVSDARADAA